MVVKKTLEVGGKEDTEQPSTGVLGGDAGGGEEKQKSTAAMAVAPGDATNLQKKLRRAERFGVPVRLSEEEKRNSRAERFGTTPASLGSSEEQKRKARAERFGTAITGGSTADEEVKKKARLARFAQDAKPKISTAEEEKRKARAIRFSSSDPPPTNGVQNSEQCVYDTCFLLSESENPKVRSRPFPRVI